MPGEEEQEKGTGTEDGNLKSCLGCVHVFLLKSNADGH